MEFYIPETKETIKAKHRPIVIITSNAEKELPDAFLRRCIFHYIEFPDQQQMEKIIRVHFDHVDETLLMQAMQAFYYIRSIDSVGKNPQHPSLSTGSARSSLPAWTRPASRRRSRSSGCSSKRTRISPPCSAA